MTGPSTPGQEGPSYAPPPLPEGWIAQWDGMSRKYYFVQLSTGASQWETPTHPAPTGPTPQATPQGGLEHPYGTPGQQQELDIITNQDGSQSIRLPDGTIEPYSGDRSLGSFAMNQLLGKKQNQGGLGGLASQFLSGGSSHNQSSNSSSGTAGIVGALAGSLLGGKKQDQPQNYSGSQNTQQSHGGGLMGSLGGMFGGHQGSSQGNNFGYSSHNNQQGGYTGSAPPTSYQPPGASQYNPPQHTYQSPPQAQPYQPPPNSYAAQASQQSSYGAQSNPQQQQYGSQQPPYGASSPQQPFGGIQHQDSYGGGPPPSQQYPPPPGYGQSGSGYGAPPQGPGNLARPHHHHFQGLHNAEHSGGLYGNSSGPSGPPVPTGSHPYQGHGQQGPPQGGGYGGGYGGDQRW